MKTDSKRKVFVIGAGLAGLSCAVHLHESGIPVEVFEASDAIGGRVRTDILDGFLLDRGFQVYLDAYRDAGRFLDLAALDLRRFEPGALVWKRGKLWKVMDIFRRPLSFFSSAAAPVGGIGDKLRVARLRHTLLRKSIADIWRSPDRSTCEYLRQFGFSERMIDDFFRCFYGGIFLEDGLVTSSRIFEFTFRMFSEGYATLPAKGMQAIPDQLASRLPPQSIHLNSPVRSIEGTTVRLDQCVLEASHVVVATDGSVAGRLVSGIDETKWNSTSCLYFAAERPPVSKPIIVLKGDREGLINNLSVPSLLSAGYAPRGQSLISVSVLGDHRETPELTERVRGELVEWFGEEAMNWKHLRTEHIQRALPIAPPGNDSPLPLHGSVLVCGDHTKSGSIEGAIQSGWSTAHHLLSKND